MCNIFQKHDSVRRLRFRDQVSLLLDMNGEGILFSGLSFRFNITATFRFSLSPVSLCFGAKKYKILMNHLFHYSTCTSVFNQALS